MRKMTIRILLSVIITSAICMMALILLVSNVDSVSRQYEENISEAAENQKMVAKISEDIYRTESLVWQHIVNEKEEDYSAHEEQIQLLLEEIPVYLNALCENLGDNPKEEEYVLLHEAIRRYVGFKSNVEVVLDLSRKGSKQSAQYYVGTALNPYIDIVNNMLDITDSKMEENSRFAAREMENCIHIARIAALLCFLAVGCSFVVCITVVFRHGRQILGKQKEEEKNHQQKVMELQYNTIVAMANLIEGRDEDTGEHVKRTSWYVDMIARSLAKEGPYQNQLNETYLENLWKAAPLHDIGKIRVSDAILCKPGKLTAEEFEIMKTHASQGGQIVYDSMKDIEEREYVELAHDVAKYHHEKWDGTGYPEGRSGDAIPLCARIMAVADVFDALTSKRCYKEAMSIEEAYQIIEQSSGTHFDPVVAEAFIRLRPQVEQYLKNE